MSENAENSKQKRETLIAKIRALLAKTIANGATEQEALLAAAKAAELMEKYDIEIGETEEIAEDEVIETDQNFPPEFRNHIMTVSMAIARLCEVEVIGLLNTVRVRTGYRIYGLPVDVEIAQYLHQVVIEAMKYELKKGSGRWFLFEKRKRDIAQHNFLDGLTTRLTERINELAWARQHKKTGNALVVAKEAMIKDAMKDVDIIKSKMRKRDIDLKSFKEGLKAADQIRLDPAINSDNKPRKALD